MGLPRIHDVIKRILAANAAGKTDGVSYFYQFEMAPSIREHFTCRLGGMRGEIRRMRFKRMPMGWKFAPLIAQQTSNVLIKDLGVEY